VILRYRVSRPGKFPIPNCEVQCPAVSPKELRIGAVYCGLVRFTADRGGGFRTKPELEKQATLVYCGLLRMDKAPRQKPARGALTTNGTNHTKGRKLNHGCSRIFTDGNRYGAERQNPSGATICNYSQLMVKAVESRA
jgi:hypothetical protein